MWIAFPKALRLSSPVIAATFTAISATVRWNPSKGASVGGLFHSIIVSRRKIRSRQADYNSAFSLVNKVKDVCRRLKPFQASTSGPIRLKEPETRNP
jgi:hypothetical protein